MFFYAAVAFADKLSVFSLGCAWKKYICTNARQFQLPLRIKAEHFREYQDCLPSSARGQVWGEWLLAKLFVLEIYKNCHNPVRKEVSDAAWWSKKDSVWGTLSS